MASLVRDPLLETRNVSTRAKYSAKLNRQLSGLVRLKMHPVAE